MHVYNDNPERDTPEEIRAVLAEYGGVSPDGQALWRMVRAENVRVRCFGDLNHFEPGFDAGALPEMGRPTDVNPVRVEVGEFWIPRYRVQGWILERWYPARTFGSRENWEREKARDGKTRLMAAWPQRGGYRMVPCGPWRTIEEAGDLRAAIRCYNFQQRNNPVNWENWELAEQAAEMEERQRAVDEYADEIRARGVGLGGLLRTVSPEAQAWRSHVAAHTAGGVMLGAAEKWG